MKTTLTLLCLFLFAITESNAQSWLMSKKERDSINQLGQKNQEKMMVQLGITKLRPGRSGNESAPNSANYDESVANPCPELPDILTTNNGKRVKDVDTWWKKRRPEIVEDFEREVYGKLPENIPDVNWTIKVIDNEFVRRTPVIVKQLVGHVDNSSYPSVQVAINAMLVVPTNVKGPVPVLMMFGRPTFPAPAQPSRKDMEKINASFKDMMIKHDSNMRAIFDKYPHIVQ